MDYKQTWCNNTENAALGQMKVLQEDLWYGRKYGRGQCIANCVFC